MPNAEIMRIADGIARDKNIEREQVYGLVLGDSGGIRERNLLHIAAAFEPLPGACVIHQELAHKSRRDAEEMRAALP